MPELQKITEFLESVKEDEDFVGEITETFFDGDLEIRLYIGKDEQEGHRRGSFSILLKWDGDFEELGKREILRVGDINTKYEEIEKSFVTQIDENLGYNAYEPILDIADRKTEEDFDIVFHDSVIVFE